MHYGGDKREHRKFNPVTIVSAVCDRKLIGEAERHMPVNGQEVLRWRRIRLAWVHIL